MSVAIRINGQARELPAPWRVAELVADLGFAGKRVAVEVNTHLQAEADRAERTIHFRLGAPRETRTVRIARDWKPGTTFPAARLLAEEGFGGIDGIFRFNNRGIAMRALEVSEVGAGGFRVIDPAPTKW